MGTKGRELWEKYKAEHSTDIFGQGTPSTGNTGRDLWNEYKRTVKIPANTPREENATASGGAQAEKKSFLQRAGLTVSGGAKGSLAGNMDAMGVAYELGQSGRTKRYTEELREAQWAVARAKHDYDADPNNWQTKDALDTAIAKMKGFADTLGKGAYEQALTAAYDAASKFETGDLKALYNGLGVVDPEQGTGVQQQAASAARDLAYGVQESASKDLQEAKEGASKFGQMLVDAGASMTQMGIDSAVSGLMGFKPTKWNGGNKILQEALGVGEKIMTPGAMIPFATRAFGGSTMDARQDGADLKGQVLYGGAQAAKEVFTEKMFNIALPFAKAYGKGGLDSVVENGIRKAAEKLGKSDVGRAALERVLKFGASAASEGLEEFVGDFFEWQMPRIYGGDTDSFGEMFSNALYDFAVGAISGAAGGAVEGGVDLYNDHTQARETKKNFGDQAQDIVNESKELAPDNKLAEKYQKKLDKGGKLTGFQLMRIMQQNENGIVEQDKQKIQSAAASRLTQLGETGDAAQIAQVITKQVAGEHLTSDEQSLIDGSRYGRRVANEIDPENVKVVATEDGIAPRDTFASEWTGRLDTKRIYPEVFNRLMPQTQKTGETTTRQEGEVTGAKYNPETGKLDAIVTDAEGKVETKPLQEAEPSPLQEELFDWSDSLKLKEAGPLMINAYRQEQQNVELYARSFKLAYEYGKAGMPMDYVNKSEGVSYLSDMQRTMAYEEGRKAERQAYENAGRSGGTASAATAKKPSVSLRGATVGGKTYAPVNRKTVDACQWASVKAMRAFSKVTGIDVVFYQSQANAKGEYEGANGFYKDGTLYLDINAGRDTVGMTETAVLKTAAHELTHFIQQNSRQYEELKKFVVERLVAEEGVNFEDLVTDKQRRESGLDYNEAVDEVVADACEMMLKDSTAAERLAKENRSLAQKIRDWLREWVENLKTAIEGLQAERTESKAMMQYAQELQKIWDDALVDAARNNRGAAQEVAPAEIKRQARVETSESINPDEKPLKGKRDDDKMGAVKASLKEDLEDGKARKEERGAFLRRATGEGIRIFEGDTIAYGYRPVRGESAGGNARQIQKELKDLGIDSEIFEGDILWNLNGVSGKKVSPQSVTVEKKLILINTNASVAPKNTAGHEAFHLWGNSDVRDAYVSEVEYNLNYTSEDFVRYQSVIANAYLGGDVDLSDTAQLQKLREELFAYISGDIHEGVNDDLLRPMFHDYDAVKAAWVKLCKDCVENKVQNSMREPVEDYIKKSTQNYGDVENDRNPFIIVEEVGIREQGANIGSEKSAGGMESNRENGRYFTGGENESGDGVRRIERDRHAGNDALSERGKSDPGGTLTDSDVKNQQRELRLSDRAVLLWAAEKAVSERSKRWSTEDLNRFDLLVKKLKGLDEAYAELEALKEERTVQLAGRKEAELKGEERFELNQTKNRIQTQKDKIQRLEADTYRIESIPQMKELLRKSRSIVEAEASYKARREYIERREAQEEMAVTRRKVERTAKRLTEYMTTNTDKKHIPEPLKKPIGELLEALDFSKKKGGRATRADLKYIEAMQELQAALAAQRLFDDTGEGMDLFKGYVDLPAGFESLLAVHVERVKNALEKHPLKTGLVRAMDIDDLKELDVILSVMSRSVTRMNEMLVNRRFALVSEAAENSIDTMSELGQHQDKTGERFVLWDNTLPWYAFQRFGEGGKAVFEGLQDGWDKLAFNMKTVLDFRQGLIKDALARKWDTEKHRVELTDPDGATVTAVLTTAQLMSLHCLSKRKQALGHLLGGGIRPSAIELTDSIGDRIKKRSLNQDKQFKLTEESLAQLLGLLTPEQVKIADAMQKFMTEQGSLWGNEVTMIRFGYRGFTEQNYFPIETDAQDRQAKTGDAKEGSLYRLQNISAVKPLVKNANNALVLRGIFDVFANHTADMAKYNALVLPILDAQKWYNYKYASKNEAGQVSTRTVQRSMTKAYGGAANNYVIKYLQDLNGVKESGDRGDTLAKKMISNYKRAMVAANMRVALLQPTAYARASAVLDYKYLARAFADKTSTKQATEEMLQHSGIALWKSLGFFDTDVGRSIRDQIKGKSSKLENLVDKTMVPAEKGDEITWARLWRACKLEVQDRQTLTGDELLKATAERFREVVYRTQVVDSTMTRSHTMRSNGTLSKMATSFMSEPTVSYNMVMEPTRQTVGDAKRLGMRVAIRRNWKALGRSLQAYVMSAAVTAIVESLYDALRDPDDDEYMEKVWKAFGGEKPETVKDQILSIIFGLNGNFAGDINPIGKVPYLRDVISILGGYSNGRMDTEAVANLKKAIDIWDEAIRLKTGELDKATKTTYYGNMTTYGMIYPTAKALSQLTGLPASAAMREVATAWNSTAGTAWPELKMRTYENKNLREAWEKYGKDSGISYTTMYRAVEALKQIEGDKDADGNTISGSQKAKYLEYIRSLGLPSAQQQAVWEAAKVTSWSNSGTPWG